VTDKEYSKNNSSQSVNLDVQTYDSNNYISGKKLELFYSQGDHTSEYRTMTDIGMYILINIVIKRLTTPMVYTVKKNVLTENTFLLYNIFGQSFSYRNTPGKSMLL